MYILTINACILLKVAKKLNTVEGERDREKKNGMSLWRDDGFCSGEIHK